MFTFTGLNLGTFRVTTCRLFLAGIIGPCLATTSYAMGWYGVEHLFVLPCFIMTISPGWRPDNFAFALLSAYCFIRDFALASASLMVLSDFDASLFSGRVVLMFLLKSAFAGGTPVERCGVAQ